MLAQACHLLQALLAESLCQTVASPAEAQEAWQ